MELSDLNADGRTELAYRRGENRVIFLTGEAPNSMLLLGMGTHSSNSFKPMTATIRQAEGPNWIP